MQVGDGVPQIATWRLGPPVAPQSVSALLGELLPRQISPASQLIVAYAESLAHPPSSAERIDAQSRALVDIRA